MEKPTNAQLAIEAFRESDTLRRHHGIIRIAPVDPVDLAVDCGCEVMFSANDSLEGMYSTSPRPSIVLGSRRPSGRIAFTCAHELGHHIFKHGIHLDAVSAGRSEVTEERLADMFAGYLLMPPPAITVAMRSRDIQLGSITPEQIWSLASYFGVGYSTLVDHMEHALQLLPPSTSISLRRTQPKQFKLRYGCPAENNILFVDQNWEERAVNVECGDHIVLPAGLRGEERLEQRSSPVGANDTTVFEATSPGYTRVFDPASDWAANVRISRKNYSGWARYRFLEE